MNDITVLKRNLSGEVTWQYKGRVLERESNCVLLEAFFNRDDTPFMNVVLKRGDRFVERFCADCWYNIFEIYDRDDEHFKGWYCNVGYPAVLEKDTVSYIDLALDLWVAADGTQTVLDEEEFLELNYRCDDPHAGGFGFRRIKRKFAKKKPPA